MLQGFPCRWKLRIVVFGEILLNEFFFKTGGERSFGLVFLGQRIFPWRGIVKSNWIKLNCKNRNYSGKEFIREHLLKPPFTKKSVPWGEIFQPMGRIFLSREMERIVSRDYFFRLTRRKDCFHKRKKSVFPRLFLVSKVSGFTYA